MLRRPEKFLIFIVVAFFGVLTYRAFVRIVKTIGRGQGKIDWSVIPGRLLSVLVKTISLAPTFRLRLGPSLMHALVAWGFIYYLVVNLGDLLEGFIPGFRFLGNSTIGNLYRFGADLLSVAAIVGMVVLLLRRFVFNTPELKAREDVLLSPRARAGIRRDSAIVGGFILTHVGSRFLGSAMELAEAGPSPWQPFASAVSRLFSGLSPAALEVGQHIFWWLALGTIVAFFPYFLYSKHLHLFFAPFNFLIKPERRSIGQLDRLNFDDETIEQFGAARLEDLSWPLIVDAYACIMCYRCQQVCPAYNTGKVLSPAAMEINKRYQLNWEGDRLARGEASSAPLWETVISKEAIWACTACGACVDICPVGNEPMRDILNIRRALVLMENEFPEQLQTAFRGMERNVNPWNISPKERMKWAEGLEVPTIDENPEPEILWWVGCAPSTDARAQKTARAFAQILNSAGVKYAVLGEQEQCTGDSARRAGNEYLFNELALANVEILNEVAPKRIVTTCPHCLHTIKNEYPDFGGNYQVIHHTQLIKELVDQGKLKLERDGIEKITFHDPCYLGRHNGILEDPRSVLQMVQPELIEMQRIGMKSFCCGAGGAQMWKEEEHGAKGVNMERMDEAISTKADTLAVGCPFCMVMLTDAAKARNTEMQVKDVAEIVAARLEK
jgi:Fe-S oxidoreductase